MRKQVICQEWCESERGWGIRPDGYSLHLSKADLEQFIKEYWSTMPDETPEEYSRPKGKPYLVEIKDKLYRRVESSEKGIRLGEYQITKTNKILFDLVD